MSGIYRERPDIRTRFRIETSPDGDAWTTFADLSDSDRDRPNAYLEGDAPARARFVRYVHGEVAAAHLAISDLRVFGTADGPPPAAPTGVTVVRDTDQRNAFARFDPVPGAIGYNVRWGVAPDRLHLTYQVWADELPARGGQVEVRALTLGVDYHFAVEAFGETGVSALSAVIAVPAT